MSTISRRTLLGSIAVASIPISSDAAHDPLVDAIAAYRAGMKDYDLNAPHDNDAADAYADISYRPPMLVLDEWSQPARSRQGAIEALRLLAEEPDCTFTDSMIAAALGYLEATA
ncbi:hypothetical protein [Sinorhizobium fredii]|uniref:hypothetical protein n=1 Tax=Rhizobium fredii TaxID=380 RepID=UPI0004BA6ACA|nr:hypothetical protein [Sinorhizobium fredii]